MFFLVKEDVKVTIRDFLEQTINKDVFDRSILALHYYGNAKYKQMLDLDEVKAQQLYTLVVENDASQEAQFESCLCDIFSYLEVDYWETDDEARLSIANLIKDIVYLN